MAWVEEQLQPLERPVHDDLIRLDRLQPDSDVGPVSGSFAVPPGSYATTRGTPIDIGSPGDLLPDHRGMVHGRVLYPEGVPAADCAVHAGKVTDGFSSLVSVPTDEAGYFAVDLSVVDPARPGAWAFQLRRSDGTDVGGRWPSGPVFAELVVELRSIGDDEEVVAALPAPVSGRVAFDASTPGRKRLALVDAAGTLLGATSATTGAVRSFVVDAGQPGHGTRFAEQCYAYDQAVALMAAVAVRRSALAHDLARGLVRLQTTGGEQAGAFLLSGRQGSPEHGDAIYRTGAHALATHALLAYAQAYPQRAPAVLPAARAGLAWLLARTATSGQRAGLVLGGVGSHVPDGAGGRVLRPDPLPWASTEHNVDAYFCYRLAAEVVGVEWAAHADALAAAVLERLWNPQERRLHQGLQESGPDTADPLDVHAWGALLLDDVGERDTALETMGEAQLAPFRVTRPAPNGRTVTGYGTAYASPGYPGMTPHVWWEGTFSVAYALRRLGEDARADETMALALPGQHPDGAFPYVSDADPAHDLATHRAVASTAWATLAAVGRGIFDTGGIG
ncbi:hypothetical protein GCM10009846_16160 [Agrococcus versicolor]|uniref:Uncharacterized protein n=2 Tax=Agrococcus versicolor TaxID=501482 RepID=A0ABP5MKV2_9MICO